ncbi:hypothetical protein [uncultured Aquimarina sp.]|uniref:hypothetical protein n=1 Tax=uncultured Aquimarina sp. TaxID=575652 RepID=UPI002609D979|nr:hypothetical protein [uncultured Aquimarina sp.]
MTEFFTRKALYKLIWSKSTTAISKEYRISTTDLRKLCKHNKIPLPLNGHWQKIKHNKPTIVIDLPMIDDNDLEEIKLVKRNKGDEDIPFLTSPFHIKVYELKNDKSFNIEVPSKLKKPHPLIIKTKKKLDDFDKILKPDFHIQRELFKDILPIHTDIKLRNRALRIMNTIISVLYKKEATVVYRNTECLVEMFGQRTEINLRQKVNRVRSKNEQGYGNENWVKSEKLEFQAGPSYKRKNWIDGKNKKLEDCIAEIIVWIEQDCKYWHDLRKKQAEEERLLEIERAKENEKLRLIQLEKDRFTELVLDSEKWHKVTILRTYIRAVEKNAKKNNGLDDKKKEWLKWAKSKADSIDPLIDKEK